MKKVLQALCVAALVSLLASCPPAALRLKVHVENNSAIEVIERVVLGNLNGPQMFEEITENLLSEPLGPGDQKNIFLRASDAAGAKGITVQLPGGSVFSSNLVEEFMDGMTVNAVLADGVSFLTIDFTVEP
ncbi:MAG: hypothetical protein SGI88_17665 [Candidatus Hydrogenedentes bacterium]|nr:hypothetical protein [Candidatus Hydrogenedentota bacterium]